MSENNDTTPRKRCNSGTECLHPEGPELPATRDHFYPQTKGMYGLNGRCKYCVRKASREYSAKQNPEEKRAKKREWAQKNRETIRERNREYRRNNPERYRERARQWKLANPDKTAEYNRNYRLEHREERREANRLWAEQNPEKIREYKRAWYHRNPHQCREWRRNNPDKRRAANREWERRNSDKARIKNHRRRARKRALPDTFTHSQWLSCLEYFNNCCAYCGKQRDFWHTIEMDHWIPLNAINCPGTVCGNILPSCKSCNSGKCDKDSEQWLITKLGKQKAAEILQRVREYFHHIQ